MSCRFRFLLISGSPLYLLQAAAAARIAGRWPKGRPSIAELLGSRSSKSKADEECFEIVRDILLTEPAAVHEQHGFDFRTFLAQSQIECTIPLLY